MAEVGKGIGEVPANELGYLSDGLEPAMSSLPEPASKELGSGLRVGIVLELAKALFEHPDSGHLEVTLLKRQELSALLRCHLLRVFEPKVFWIISQTSG